MKTLALLTNLGKKNDTNGIYGFVFKKTNHTPKKVAWVLTLNTPSGTPTNDKGYMICYMYAKPFELAIAGNSKFTKISIHSKYMYKNIHKNIYIYIHIPAHVGLHKSHAWPSWKVKALAQNHRTIRSTCRLARNCQWGAKELETKAKDEGIT